MLRSLLRANLLCYVAFSSTNTVKISGGCPPSVGCPGLLACLESLHYINSIHTRRRYISVRHLQHRRRYPTKPFLRQGQRIYPHLRSPAAPPAAMGDIQLPNETDLAGTHHGKRPASINIYKQPLDSPGLVPVHQKQAVAVGLPILEILQRLLYRLQSGYNLDKVLALIALYRAGVPVYRYLKHIFVYLFTSQITVPEYDPVGKEILAWMSSEVMSKSSTTKAMVVTGGDDGGIYEQENYYRHMGQRGQAAQLVQYMPPIGKKVFW